MEVGASLEGQSQNGALQPPKVEVKALQGERQSDALFQEYDKENQKKVRSAFRLNPLFVGLSEDMTYATAQASMEMSEQQVFAPERTKIDEVINLRLLSDVTGKPPQYWWAKSNAPRITNPSDIVAALPNLAAVGAMTPNTAINIANELFGMDVKPIEEPWGDIPYSATTALMSRGPIIGFEGVIGEAYPPPPSPFGPGGPAPDDEDDPPDGPTGDGGADDGEDEEQDPADKNVAVQATGGHTRPPRKRILASDAAEEGTLPEPEAGPMPGMDRAKRPPKQFKKYSRRVRALPQKRRNGKL
jgi:hypothetical protein